MKYQDIHDWHTLPSSLMVHSRKLGKPSFVIGVCEPVIGPEDAVWILGSLKAGQQWWNTSGKQTRLSLAVVSQVT